jgi:DNA-binding NarL/FixJ family response regulator
VDSDSATPGGPIEVLVCDDSASLRELYRLELEAEGDISVVGTAADGDAAIDAARDAGADVIVLDLVMPGVDGVDAVARIREASPAIAVLVVSGYSDPALARAVIEQGAFAWLDKASTGAADLRAAVREAATMGSRS